MKTLKIRPCGPSAGGVISSTVTASIAVYRGWALALDVAVWAMIGLGIILRR
jgi:hypothetical protein